MQHVVYASLYFTNRQTDRQTNVILNMWVSTLQFMFVCLYGFLHFLFAKLYFLASLFLIFMFRLKLSWISRIVVKDQPEEVQRGVYFRDSQFVIEEGFLAFGFCFSWNRGETESVMFNVLNVCYKRLCKI